MWSPCNIRLKIRIHSSAVVAFSPSVQPIGRTLYISKATFLTWGFITTQFTSARSLAIVQHRAACNVHQCTTTGSQIFVVSHSNKSPILALEVGWSHFFLVISPGKYSRNHRNMGCNNFRLKPCNVCNSTSPCQQRHTVGNTKVPLPMMWFIHIWAHFRDDCSQAISFHQRRESFFFLSQILIMICYTNQWIKLWIMFLSCAFRYKQKKV